MIDHRSYTQNLVSREIKAWKKKFRPGKNPNSWRLWYCCSALPTEPSSQLRAHHVVTSLYTRRLSRMQMLRKFWLHTLSTNGNTRPKEQNLKQAWDYKISAQLEMMSDHETRHLTFLPYRRRLFFVPAFVFFFPPDSASSCSDPVSLSDDELSGSKLSFSSPFLWSSSHA